MQICEKLQKRVAEYKKENEQLEEMLEQSVSLLILTLSASAFGFKIFSSSCGSSHDISAICTHLLQCQSSV